MPTVRTRGETAGRSRILVASAAVVAAVLRFPGALWPIRPDEAGFTLVARSWHPGPHSLYGFYWVDRPPSLIALVRLSDAIGGPLFLRVIAAVGCAVLVLAAAGCARAWVRLREGSPAAGDRVAGWTAVAAAVLVGNLNIDPAAAKGEILGIPLVMTGCWLTLRALERRAWSPALLAGLLAMSAVGLKQNMIGGLVFGAVLLVGSAVTRRLPVRDLARLGGAALVGAALPVVATVVWALVAGVHLHELWYAVFGFREDASRVISAVPSASNRTRFVQLLLLLVVTGMTVVVAWFVLSLVPLLRRTPVMTLAVLLMVAGDVVGLLLGGSYWKPYAFSPIPGVLLCVIMLLELAETRPWRRVVGRGLVVAMAGSTALSVVLFLLHSGWVGTPPKEYATGRAIAGAAAPGDSLVVYGGRADVQFGSGLPSPYRYLWSLPMRVLDPHLAELRGVLDGPSAPTWFVAWSPLSAWDHLGDQGVGATLARRYELHDDVCGRAVYVIDGAQRPHLHVDCRRWPF